jgi:hypothetical protein
MLPRPRVRGDCVNGPRPCPWAACRFNLTIDHINAAREPVVAFDDDVERASCALDVADGGPVELQVIGDMLGVTRERVRQIEAAALVKLRRRLDSSMLEGWAAGASIVQDDGWSDFDAAGFRAAVTKAYERIVPASERGTLRLFRGRR